jgi:predicted nucleotidyltransferase
MKLQFDTDKLTNICQANDISFLGLFGSHAEGKEHPDSDVDLLVDFKNTKSLLEKGKVLIELQDLFKKDIDLVSRKNVKPLLKPYIEKQLIILYGER